MTTLSEPRGAAEVDEPQPRMPSGTAVALEAAGIGLVVLALVVLLAWATDSRSSASTGQALRVAAQGWLLAHQVPLAVEGGRVGLAPVGLALLPVMLLARAGAGLAGAGMVARARDLRSVAACLALPYAACAGVVALVAGTDAARPQPVVAALAAGAHAALAGGLGAAVQAGLLPELAARLSEPVRAAARAGLLAVGTLLGAGALLAGTALALSAGQASALAGAVAPGAGGALGLLLLGLALVPNAVVWSAAYLAGPGFALGPGSAVTVDAVTVAHVPALPVLAALPAPGPAPGWALALLALPLAAGVLAGASLSRRRPTPGPRAQRRRVAGAAAVAGGLFGLLAVLAGGPVGPGLSPAGPSAWQLALAVSAEVGLGALVAVEAAAWRRRRATRS